MAKNNLKSVRISDEILNVVESCKGEGFNQKFENLVIDFKKTLPEREAYLESLNSNIEQKIMKLEQLKKSIDRAEQIKSGIEKLLESL